MIPCTRLYVYPTATPMGQASKNKPSGLRKKWWENIRGNNSFLIIITPKDNTKAFKKSENKHSKSQEIVSDRHFSALYVIIEVSPPPAWTCPLYHIPTYFLHIPPPPSVQPPPPPPLVGIGPMNMMIIIIAPNPPTLKLQKRREATVWLAKRGYLYPITLTNTIHHMESIP